MCIYTIRITISKVISKYIIIQQTNIDCVLYVVNSHFKYFINDRLQVIPRLVEFIICCKNKTRRNPEFEKTCNMFESHIVMQYVKCCSHVILACFARQ